jgi:hypothetical protein
MWKLLGLPQNAYGSTEAELRHTDCYRAKVACQWRDSNPQVPKETDLQSAEPTNCSTLA